MTCVSPSRATEANETVAPPVSRVTGERAASTLEARFHKQRSPQFSLEVDFNAVPGFTILFGPSGSGKTTLLDCIAGLTTPESGRIAIGNRIWFDSAQRTNLAVAKRHVGYVLQTLALFPHL